MSKWPSFSTGVQAVQAPSPEDLMTCYHSRGTVTSRGLEHLLLLLPCGPVLDVFPLPLRVCVPLSSALLCHCMNCIYGLHGLWLPVTSGQRCSDGGRVDAGYPCPRPP